MFSNVVSSVSGKANAALCFLYARIVPLSSKLPVFERKNRNKDEFSILHIAFLRFVEIVSML